MLHFRLRQIRLSMLHLRLRQIRPLLELILELRLTMGLLQLW
jgi:hypothetical protein